MSAIANRLSAVIKFYGEPFTVGAATRTGIFTPLPAERAEKYLTSTELNVAGRPVWAGYVPFDDTTAVAATLAWNGITVTVKRVMELRLKNGTVAKMLILAT